MNLAKNEILKGIILGLLSLFVLEFGTMAVLAGFYNENIWYYQDTQYSLLLLFNAIIAGLLGVSIAKNLKAIKKWAYILNLGMLGVIIAGYAYFVWFRFSHYV